jgi:hypothetical protein
MTLPQETAAETNLLCEQLLSFTTSTKLLADDRKQFASSTDLRELGHVLCSFAPVSSLVATCRRPSHHRLCFIHHSLSRAASLYK